ncbi:FadR/GntR family transcriptional regulator [Marinimicrobium alkaliphilum]|uniref:FadR/GntR family transcriptional regulator n=1 Tax=Marinimicrobium alkaliphilum TaxID=2202654 RepID=UPI000DB97AFD|nr:FCD domain-containing protein [Marinimicrobium alkaliphilum]
MLDALGKDIVAGLYPEGTRLPLEAELCENFGISRPVLREATKALGAKGMLCAKPRVGLQVQARARWNLLDHQVLSWMIEAMPVADFDGLLLGVQGVVLPECAAQAAHRATGQDCEQLESALEVIEREREQAPLLDAYERFHETLLALSTNELLAHIGHTLLTAQVSALRGREDWLDGLGCDHHRPLYAAISARDTEASRRASSALLRAQHPPA